MSKKVVTLIVFFMFFNLFSQEKKGLVYYGQKESMGMGAPVGHDYNSVMVFNSKASLYITRNDSLEGKRIFEIVTTETPDQIFMRTKATNKYGFRYYTNSIKDSMFSRDIGFRYVKEKIPSINWKITQEKKKIGNFECIKAKCNFRGRDYTVWFTMQIPFRFGPWKLQGLPGLILEAYDTKKEVYFYFKKLVYPTDTEMIVGKPVIQPKQKGKKWISFEVYKNYLINGYLNSIESGRLMAESFDNTEAGGINQKYSMKKTYIENFKISDEYLKKR